MRRSLEKIGLGLALLFATFCFLTLASPLLQGKVNFNNDLGHFHFPLRSFYSRSLASGESFLWFPNLFCGFYVHGEGQVGMYHPWHLLLYATLPLPVAFNLEILANYPWAFAGTYLLLRRRLLGRDTAAVGALVFTFAGFNLFHYMHVNAVSVVVQIPWLLLCLDLAMTDVRPRRAAWGRLGVGLLTASQLLLGYPQYVFYSLLAEGLYALFLARQTPGIGWRRPAGWVSAKAFGLLGGAAQLLPTWDLLSHSDRVGLSASFSTYGSLHPFNLIQVFAPYVYKARVVAPSFYHDVPTPLMGPARDLLDWRVHEFGLYNGAIVPVLAIWLWLRRRDLGMLRPLAGAAGALAGLALGLAIGSYNPLFRLYTSLPMADKFRLPSRHLVLYHLATAVLVAIALADLSRFARSGRSLPWRRLWLLAAPLVAAILVSVGPDRLGSLWPSVLREMPRSSSSTMIDGLVIAAFAGLLAALAARGYRLAPLGLLILAGVDQSYYLTSFLRYNQCVVEPPATTGPTSATRVAMTGDNRLTLSGHRLLGGYVGLGPSRRLNYESEASWRAAAVGMAADPSQPGRPWKPIPDPRPRAWLVTRVVSDAGGNPENPTSDATAELARIDLRDSAIVALSGGLELDEDARPGTATIIEDRPGSIDVETVAESRQLLVLAESRYPGWMVRIDDRPSKILPVNHDFQGCVVEAGRHRIAWRFEPESTRLGVRLSILGVALMVGSFGWSRAASRTPRPTGVGLGST